MLDPTQVRIGVTGTGAGLQRRLALLERSSVRPAAIFKDRPPSENDIAGLHVLFVAGFSETQSRTVSDAARRQWVLVNVEDAPALCDFHVPAEVRRGDLVVAVSTGGRSPALAKVLREDLEHRFGPEWSDRLDEAAALRGRLRAEGIAPSEVSERTRALVADKGWLT
jgi:precorrin-2 dehydrogenase